MRILSLLLGVEAVWVTAPAPEIQRAIDRCYFRRAGQAGAAAAQAGQAATEEGTGLPCAARPTTCWPAAPMRRWRTT